MKNENSQIIVTIMRNFSAIIRFTFSIRAKKTRYNYKK